MARRKTTKIIVRTVFDGTQTDQQAFINLIVKNQNKIDKNQYLLYSKNREINSDIRI